MMATLFQGHQPGGVMRLRILTVILLLSTLSCGGGDDNAGNPSGSGSGSGNGGPAGNKGTMTATIGGVAFNGFATIVRTEIQVGKNMLIMAGGTADLKTQLSFGAAAAVGTTSIGGLSPTNALLAVTPGTATWQANITGGSGSVTIDTITATTATGRFSFVMIPVPGSGATGNKTVANGAFNVTF